LSIVLLKWTTLGGSVNESTRIENVERVFLLFGKLAPPVEFVFRPYEECLSEVVVTHYPRYRIDMKLGGHETIFDKMNTSYDALRKSGNAVGEVVKYYKGQLGEGESLWWIDSDETIDDGAAVSMNVRLWSSLAEYEKTELFTSLFALFPAMLSTENNKKYNRAVLWLVTRHGVVDPSFRDKFSASGKVSISTPRGIFVKLPQVYKHINLFARDIREQIESAPESVLCETWQVQTIERGRVSQWVGLASGDVHAGKYEANEVLKAIFEAA
jgi:hypothetical protein